MRKKSLILIGIILFLSQNSANTAINEKITETRGYISASVEKTKEVSPNVATVTFTKENSSKILETASKDNKTA